MPICLMLLMQEVCFAFDLALARAGRSIAARIAIMAITTSSSIKVNPASVFLLLLSSANRCFESINDFCIYVWKLLSGLPHLGCDEIYLSDGRDCHEA